MMPDDETGPTEAEQGKNQRRSLGVAEQKIQSLIEAAEKRQESLHKEANALAEKIRAIDAEVVAYKASLKAVTDQ